MARCDFIQFSVFYFYFRILTLKFQRFCLDFFWDFNMARRDLIFVYLDFSCGCHIKVPEVLEI